MLGSVWSNCNIIVHIFLTESGLADAVSQNNPDIWWGCREPINRFFRSLADAKRSTLIESLPALQPSPGQPGDCGKRGRGLLPLCAVEWFARGADPNERLCHVR